MSVFDFHFSINKELEASNKSFLREEACLIGIRKLIFLMVLQIYYKRVGIVLIYVPVFYSCFV